MKMDIVESDLKQLYALVLQHQDAIESLEERIINIEHDLALVLSVIKNRKNST
jgi:hypothetical protein